MYKLLGYKFNKAGQEISRFEQTFVDLSELRRKLNIVLQNYENYTIYKDKAVIETNCVVNTL